MGNFFKPLGSQIIFSIGMAHPGQLKFQEGEGKSVMGKQEEFQSISSIIVIHNQREKWMQAAADFRWNGLILPPPSETLFQERESESRKQLQHLPTHSIQYWQDACKTYMVTYMVVGTSHFDLKCPPLTQSSSPQQNIERLQHICPS